MGASGAIDRAAYPFTSRRARVAGHELHYVDEGSGPAILFVHGTPTWSFEWRHQIAALRAEFRCIAPDLLGFGLSDRPRAAIYTPQAHAERLAAFVTALGLDRFSLVVHDFGGPIGLPLALDRPAAVERLAILNSWMWSFADDREMAGRARLASGALGRWLYRHANASLRLITPSAYGDRRKLTPAIHRQYLDRFPDPDSRELVLWALARALLGSSAYYDQLWQRRALLAGRPAAIIWGLKDSAFRPAQLARWRALLPAAAVTALPGAGHWPHEEEPAAVTAALRALLAA